MLFIIVICRVTWNGMIFQATNDCFSQQIELEHLIEMPKLAIDQPHDIPQYVD